MTKFPIKSLDAALEYIEQLEKESAEQVELLIEVSNEIKKGNYEYAWKKAVAYLEGLDFEALMNDEITDW
ncbi:hypothetical protein NIIg32_gp57 [Parageobacillus phage vB_PtoS_NIIg3.2]|nr:hypothetical protein NIIg32_gp57 [Parageobacillus phage vB_PtoS_NIIg3.2]